MTTLEPATSRVNWRTPGVIIVCGCLMATLSFGPRSALGFFLTPMSQENGWGREVFSLALAMQNLLWGVAQPFAGAIADRSGPFRVLAGGRRRSDRRSHGQTAVPRPTTGSAW